MKTWKHRWSPGDKRRLALDAGVSPQYLSDILAGRRQCHPDLANRLETAAANLGYRIPRAVWVFRDMRASNPLFCKQ